MQADFTDRKYLKSHLVHKKHIREHIDTAGTKAHLTGINMCV